MLGILGADTGMTCYPTNPELLALGRWFSLLWNDLGSKRCPEAEEAT